MSKTEVGGKSVSTKNIAYVSSSNAADDLLEGLVKILFPSFTMYGYPWEVREVEEKLAEHGVPSVILLSPDLHSTKKEREDLWVAIRRSWPSVPVIWLEPDDDDSSFVPDTGAVVGLIATLEFDADTCLRNLIGVISKVLRTRPSFPL